MHTHNIWKLFLVPWSLLYNPLYVQLYLNTLTLYVAVSNISAAVTKYITLEKLGYFNSHTLREKKHFS